MTTHASTGIATAPAWRDEWSSAALLAAATGGTVVAAGSSLARFAVPLERCELLQGLDAAQQLAVKMRLIRRALAPGQQLFDEGDPGTALYLLTEGSISVVDRTRAQRYLSFSPGRCFGETAVLDGGGRTAAAVADVLAIVHKVPAAALSELQATDPALAAFIYRNLARHLSARLRSAAAAWRQAAG